jgi:hypothetical protein
MEIETMSAKILPAIVVGSLLATTALAAAQTRYYQPQGYPANPNYYDYYQQPQTMMPTPDVYWQEPYAGTPFQNVVPYGANEQSDPYAGTAFDNVAPY